MLLQRAVLNSVLKLKTTNFVPAANAATGGWHDERLPIGNREWVGYGVTSAPHYVDRIDYPLPAVRFQEIKGDLIALREKEKGDWKKLTLEEKKKLYRASFCQTLAEVRAPTGQWKSILGGVLGMISLGVWFFIFIKQVVMPPLPDSFSEENRAKMLRFMIVNRDGFIGGIASKWDYEKDDWKK